MAYLLSTDYIAHIQAENLNQIKSNDDAVLRLSENMAIAQIKSYLSKRIDLTKELLEVTEYDYTATYTAGQVVILTGIEYDAGTTYSVNDLVVYDENVYICIQSGVDKISNASYFTILGDNKTLYYTEYPESLYDYEETYEKDDVVFYDGRTYTAKATNTGIKPDDEDYGTRYWTDEGAYTFTSQLITNTTYFTEGDLRNYQLLMIAIDLTLYHIHKRISPRNIPDLRVKCYDDAINWLEKCSSGKIIPNMAYITPRSDQSGLRTRFGYSQKNTNTY